MPYRNLWARSKSTMVYGFFSRASAKGSSQKTAVIYIFTHSHLLIYIFTLSHLLIYIFTLTPADLHLHTLTPLIYIFTPSHLRIYIFTPSHLLIYIFTPSHLLIYFTSSHLLIYKKNRWPTWETHDWLATPEYVLTLYCLSLPHPVVSLFFCWVGCVLFSVHGSRRFHMSKQISPWHLSLLCSIYTLTHLQQSATESTNVGDLRLVSK